VSKVLTLDFVTCHLCAASQIETAYLRYIHFLGGTSLALYSFEAQGGFMKSLKTLLVVLLAAGSMVACNKNDTGAAAPARANSATLGTPGSAIGSVSNYDMTNQVRGFLAADGFDTQSIKSASSSTGVIFNGVVRFDNNNQLIPNQSYINLRVTYIDQNNAQQVLDMGIYGVQGQVQTGYGYASANIVFEDAYGTVTMSGYYDNSNFTGDMNYFNKATNQQGKLGQFRIQTCGFFKCVQ
jgi:hypothetical protein